ncbi:MAG TPA: helix-turn-helix domain-containing protein [Solirubrobacterales bacterium]|nr:helix-turn-helix domain-containing protein [Solirubrobacterales bacterium]
MDLPRSTEDPLTQPTRARIFATLAEVKEAMRTDELASRLGLHPNGVRVHLERLQEAGLVERRQQRAGRGRPGDRWSVAPDARPSGEAPSAYASLAVWLARAIPAGPARLREVERTGREIGRELAPKGGGEPVEGLRQTFAALGFQPSMKVKAGGGLTCRLENCPYRDSVRENANVVCTLHRGITAGVLEELAPNAELIGFEPHDPDRAGCLVEVSRE